MTEGLINIEDNGTEATADTTAATAAENNKSENKGEKKYTPETNPERFVEFENEKIEIPDNYWDAQNNKANLGAIVKANRDLRSQISDKSPKDGLYKITVPEDLKDKIEADPESPLFKVAAAYAKDHKMSQEDFDQLVGLYFNDMASNSISDEDFIKQEKEQLSKLYGKKTGEVVEGIENWLKNSGLQDKDVIGEIQLLATTANGVKALDWFIKQSKANGNIMPAASGHSGSDELNEDMLKSLMMQPGYTEGTDKALIKRIEDGWKKLYPDK